MGSTLQEGREETAREVRRGLKCIRDAGGGRPIKLAYQGRRFRVLLAIIYILTSHLGSLPEEYMTFQESRNVAAYAPFESLHCSNTEWLTQVRGQTQYNGRLAGP